MYLRMGVSEKKQGKTKKKKEKELSSRGMRMEKKDFFCWRMLLTIGIFLLAQRFRIAVLVYNL